METKIIHVEGFKIIQNPAMTQAQLIEKFEHLLNSYLKENARYLVQINIDQISLRAAILINKSNVSRVGMPFIPGKA